METNELLKAISDMMDQKLEPIKSDLQSLKDEQAAMKSDLQKQIRRTERTLRAEIIDSENMILDEVSRVYHILNDHIADKNIHTA